MELELKGKIALVTGSSRGIGYAIAKTLHAEGCQVVINGRNSESLASAAKTLPGAVIAQGDMSQKQDAKRIVEQVLASLSKIDILICNVGSGRSVPPGDESYDEWQRVFAINLWSTTNIIEAARASLIASKGTIVCISSICGNEAIKSAPVTYSAAKAALNAYVRGIARPLGKQGIRINAVAPGNILFEGSVWSRKLAEDATAVQKILEQDVALERLGTPENVADLVAFLASPRASFATGGIWTLDGGQTHS